MSDAEKPERVTVTRASMKSLSTPEEAADAGWPPGDDVDDEAAAVDRAVAQHMKGLLVYDVLCERFKNGKIRESDPLNPRQSYIGFPRVYMRDDCVAELEAAAKLCAEMDMERQFTAAAQDAREFTAQIRQVAAAVAKGFPADTAFVFQPHIVPGENIFVYPLKEGEKVFDEKGQRIWPDPGLDFMLRKPGMVS